MHIKVLSLKVATLVALASACRASEICGFNLKYMQVTSTEVIFTLTELTKTSKVKDIAKKVTFPSCGDKLLDVRSLIIDYVNATEQARQSESKFLISYVKPHKAIKPCTLARWLRNMLTLAGIDTSVFKPHSTRGAATSKANKFGLSAEQILNKANWKSVSTFQKYYNKPIQTGDEFAQTVLQSQE